MTSNVIAFNFKSKQQQKKHNLTEFGDKEPQTQCTVTDMRFTAHFAGVRHF